MQQKRASPRDEAGGSHRTGGTAAAAPTADRDDASVPRGCYGVQVLIVGRRKHWRDAVSAEVRRAGYTATAVDCAVDALSILVLGLPVDVLVTDVDLRGDVRCARLVGEARALRPNLGIVFANDLAAEEAAEDLADALLLPPGIRDGALAVTLREALAARD